MKQLLWSFIAIGTIVTAAVLLRNTKICVLSRIKTATLEVKNIANALDIYQVKHQRLPEALSELVPNDIKEIGNDPWGHPFVYLHGDLFSEPRFVVMSVGKDGIPGTKDDVMAWDGDVGSP